MKKLKFLFLLFSIPLISSCSNQKNNTFLNFKNSIEYSIESSSNSINPLINKINILVNDGDIDKLSMEEYHNCKANLIANKEFVMNLVEVDIEFNLKEKTIKYLELEEKILDSFILPVIKFLNAPNQNEIFNTVQLKNGFLLLESMVNHTDDLSNSLEKFCLKYQLPIKMSEFEKKEYTQKIEILKRELKNRE